LRELGLLERGDQRQPRPEAARDVRAQLALGLLGRADDPATNGFAASAFTTRALDRRRSEMRRCHDELPLERASGETRRMLGESTRPGKGRARSDSIWTGSNRRENESDYQVIFTPFELLNWLPVGTGQNSGSVSR